MHVAVTWDIKTSGARWTELDEQMRNVLKAYSWVRPLSTFYIVRVNGELDRQTILGTMTTVAKSTTESINFLISPVMSAGQYDGYLPENTWKDINERTSS